MQNDKRVYNKTLKGDAAEEKMVLAALLLVSVTSVVSGTDFEERITEKSGTGIILIRLFTEKDRNIINEKNENFIFFLFIMYCCTRSKD